MRTLILAATALAFVSSAALAQDKAGTSPAPAAQTGDTAAKGEATRDGAEEESQEGQEIERQVRRCDERG